MCVCVCVWVRVHYVEVIENITLEKWLKQQRKAQTMTNEVTVPTVYLAHSWNEMFSSETLPHSASSAHV